MASNLIRNVLSKTARRTAPSVPDNLKGESALSAIVTYLWVHNGDIDQPVTREALEEVSGRDDPGKALFRCLEKTLTSEESRSKWLPDTVKAIHEVLEQTAVSDDPNDKKLQETRKQLLREFFLTWIPFREQIAWREEEGTEKAAGPAGPKLVAYGRSLEPYCSRLAAGDPGKPSEAVALLTDSAIQKIIAEHLPAAPGPDTPPLKPSEVVVCWLSHLNKADRFQSDRIAPYDKLILETGRGGERATVIALLPLVTLKLIRHCKRSKDGTV